MLACLMGLSLAWFGYRWRPRSQGQSRGEPGVSASTPGPSTPSAETALQPPGWNENGSSFKPQLLVSQGQSGGPPWGVLLLLIYCGTGLAAVLLGFERVQLWWPEPESHDAIAHKTLPWILRSLDP